MPDPTGHASFSPDHWEKVAPPTGLQHAPPACDETASASRQDRQAILGRTDSQAGDPPQDRLKGKRTSSRTPALLLTPPPPRMGWGGGGTRHEANHLRIGRFGSGVPLAIRDSFGGRGEHPRSPSPLRGIPPSSGDVPPHWLEHGVRHSRFAHWLKATRLARPWSGANASVANGTPPTGARHVCASERPMVEGSQGGCRCC